MSGWVCAVPLIGALFAGCGEAPPLAVGYVEGDYANLAPVATATLVEVAVRQGDAVTAGQVVARQERSDAEIALAEAEAARAQAAAELADLREGSRPEEIAVIEASRDAARVRLAETERVAQRQIALSRDGIVSEATLDAAVAERDAAAAALAELEAQLAVARLPARAGRLEAAEHRLEGAEAAARQAAWLLAQRDVVAPADGEIADIFRRAGEIAGPGAPVVALLPVGAWKLVVFVGEPDLAAIAPGTGLAARCDGCPEGLAATVTYVSDAPEFTPPVIYSVENRQKLVYRVEARPDPGAEALKPGQIVDVVLAGE